MPRRPIQLLQAASVCEDANWLRDPTVVTLAEAKERGHVRCPVFAECYAGMLEQRNVGCTVRLGQDMARFMAKDGSTLATEIRDFRGLLAQKPAKAGFIDPYIDPEQLVTDDDEVCTMVAGWAQIVLNDMGESIPEAVAASSPKPPPTSRELQTLISTAHCAHHENFTQGCSDCGMARLVAQDQSDVVMPGGVPTRVPRGTCRCPILRVGDSCPVHGG